MSIVNLRVLALIVLGLFLPALYFVFREGKAGLVYAAEPKCDFKSQLEEIEAVRGNFSLSGFERLRQELNLRESLLRRIIDCAVFDARKTQSALMSLKLDGEARKVREKLVYNFDRVISYYEFQNSKIDGFGLQQSKDFARELLEWRENNLAPLVEEAGNFIIWGSNQAIFETAEKRLVQINQTLKALKLIENSKIRELFEESEKTFADAKEKNLKAFQSLVDAKKEEHPLAFVKDSLEVLARTYQSFFAISKEVKKILPY